MMIDALIIDDETRARSLLRGLLAEYCPEVNVLGEAADLPSGVKAIRRLKPKIVFLDIEMPGYSGLELIDFFNADEIDFCIIFTTAYDKYALRAFKLSAIDYLLKPIDPIELAAAVQRVEQRDASMLLQSNRYDALKNISPQRIGIPTLNGMRFIEVASVLYFKADSTYTEIMTNMDERIVVSRILKNFEDALDGHTDFLRIHKSFLINTNFVTDYVKSARGYIIMANKYEVPVSPDKVQEFLSKNIFIKR